MLLRNMYLAPKGMQRLLKTKKKKKWEDLAINHKTFMVELILSKYILKYFGVFIQNFCTTTRNIAFSSKTFAFPKKLYNANVLRVNAKALQYNVSITMPP